MLDHIAQGIVLLRFTLSLRMEIPPPLWAVQKQNDLLFRSNLKAEKYFQGIKVYFSACVFQ